MEDNQKNVFLLILFILLLCVLLYFIFSKKSNAFGYKKYTSPNFYGCKKVNKAPNKDKGIYSNINACLQDLVPCSGNQDIETLSKKIQNLSQNDVNKPSAEDIQQLIIDLLTKTTFKDFIQQSADKQYDLIFGIKGNWSSYMKVLLFKKLFSLKITDDLKVIATQKIVDNYKPSEFNKLTDDQFIQLVSNILVPVQPGPVIPISDKQTLRRSF